MSTDFADFREEITSAPGYAGQMVHVEEIPARKAVYEELSPELPEVVKAALEHGG